MAASISTSIEAPTEMLVRLLWKGMPDYLFVSIAYGTPDDVKKFTQGMDELRPLLPIECEFGEEKKDFGPDRNVTVRLVSFPNPKQRDALLKFHKLGRPEPWMVKQAAEGKFELKEDRNYCMVVKKGCEEMIARAIDHKFTINTIELKPFGKFDPIHRVSGEGEKVVG